MSRGRWSDKFIYEGGVDAELGPVQQTRGAIEARLSPRAYASFALCTSASVYGSCGRDAGRRCDSGPRRCWRTSEIVLLSASAMSLCDLPSLHISSSLSSSPGVHSLHTRLAAAVKLKHRMAGEVDTAVQVKGSVGYRAGLGRLSVRYIISLGDARTEMAFSVQHIIHVSYSSLPRVYRGTNSP